MIITTRYNSVVTKRELTFIGASLYASEGTKARRDFRRENGYIYSIEMTNSNSDIIGVFSKFLDKIIKVDKSRLRGQLFFYPDLDEVNLKKHWSAISGIPLSQFQKSICLKSKTSKFKPSPFGTFKIRYSCKKDFIKLSGIIDSMWRDARVV